MPIIDPRLNDPNCAADVTEDFNRVLNIVDGKSALPEIEEGDAGKVLTVNADEDAAVWVTPGGGGVLVVHVTADPNDGSKLVSDKTFSEIYDAAISGASIAVFSFGTYLTNYALWGGPGDGSYFEYVEFSGVFMVGTDPSVISITFSQLEDETVITVQTVTLSTDS